MTLTLAQNGCFHSGIIQHELMHSLGKFKNLKKTLNCILLI